MQIEGCYWKRALCDKAGQWVDAFLDNTQFSVLIGARREGTLVPSFVICINVNCRIA